MQFWRLLFPLVQPDQLSQSPANSNNIILSILKLSLSLRIVSSLTEIPLFLPIFTATQMYLYCTQLSPWPEMLTQFLFTQMLLDMLSFSIIFHFYSKSIHAWKVKESAWTVSWLTFHMHTPPGSSDLITQWSQHFWNPLFNSCDPIRKVRYILLYWYSASSFSIVSPHPLPPWIDFIFKLLSAPSLLLPLFSFSDLYRIFLDILLYTLSCLLLFFFDFLIFVPLCIYHHIDFTHHQHGTSRAFFPCLVLFSAILSISGSPAVIV